MVPDDKHVTAGHFGRSGCCFGTAPWLPMIACRRGRTCRRDVDLPSTWAAEEDQRLPCSVRVPAGLGFERPFTIWDLGGVDRDPKLQLRLLRTICGPGSHRPV